MWETKDHLYDSLRLKRIPRHHLFTVHSPDMIHDRPFFLLFIPYRTMPSLYLTWIWYDMMVLWVIFYLYFVQYTSDLGFRIHFKLHLPYHTPTDGFLFRSLLSCITALSFHSWTLQWISNQSSNPEQPHKYCVNDVLKYNLPWGLIFYTLTCKVCWHFSLIRLAHTHSSISEMNFLERKQSLPQKRKQKRFRELPPGGACMVEMWKRHHGAAKILRSMTQVLWFMKWCESKMWMPLLTLPLEYIPMLRFDDEWWIITIGSALRK